MVEYKAAKSSTAKPSGNSYWIAPPGQTKKVRYRRVSGFISVIDDPSLLTRRDTRYAAYGVAQDAKIRSDMLEIDLEGDERWQLDKLIERAARKAGKWYKADYGTATHAVTEDHDAGHNVFTKDPPDTPAVQGLSWGPMAVLKDKWTYIRKDVEAYAALLDAYQIEYTSVEATVVLDDYQVAGTLDRLMSIGNFRDMEPFEGFAVGDVKTGNLDYGQIEKPMQFKCYAGGVLYNHDTHERKPHGANPDVAVVIHLPAMEANPTLVRLDLSQAAEDLELAQRIWQRRSGEDINSWKKFGIEDYLREQIEAAQTEEELESLYRRTQATWTTDHVDLAKQKKF